MSIWPTKVEVTRKRVTSEAVPSRSPTTSATPTTRDARRAAACSSDAGTAGDPALERRGRTLNRRSAPRRRARVLRRSTWAWPRLVRRSSRAGDALLHDGGVVGPGHLLDDLALGELAAAAARTTSDGQHGGDREEEERRPPGEARDQPQRPGRQQGAGRHPDRPAQQRDRPRGCRRRSGRGSRRRPARSAPTAAGQRGVEQVGAQPAPSARSTMPTQPVFATVSISAPPTTQSASSADQLRGRVVGEPTGHDRGQRREGRRRQRARQAGERSPGGAAAASRPAIRPSGSGHRRRRGERDVGRGQREKAPDQPRKRGRRPRIDKSQPAGAARAGSEPAGDHYELRTATRSANASSASRTGPVGQHREQVLGLGLASATT